MIIGGAPAGGVYPPEAAGALFVCAQIVPTKTTLVTTKLNAIKKTSRLLIILSEK
jgi:hypothetical protein